MAIEFQARTPREFSIRNVLQRTNQHLARLGTIDRATLVGSIAETWGNAESHAICALGEAAEISLMCHRAGSEEELGTDGGFWLVASADRLRTGASAVLALLMAISTAEELGGMLTDEWSILTPQREIDPETALHKLQSIVGSGSAVTLGSRFGAEVGIPE